MSGHRRPTRSDAGSAKRSPGADPSSFERRRLLQGGLGGLGLLATGALSVACGGTGATTTDGIDPGPDETLTALFPRDIAYLAAGSPSRLVYTITDAEGVPASTISEPMTFSAQLDGTEIGDPVEVAPRGDGVPRPYLPYSLTFPQPGLYDIFATRGDVRLNNQVIVNAPGEVTSPLVGMALPPARTPTLTQSFDVNPICTSVPTCPFHEYDLTTLLGTGRPIVVLLATPAYCQTAACGPILDLLIGEASALPANVAVIHAEVYENPKESEDLNDALLSPLAVDYEMGFEPSLFVANSSNVIVARGDIVVDRGEMAQMLALAR